MQAKEGEGTASPPFLTPPPLLFPFAFQDGGCNQCKSEFLLNNACSAGYSAVWFIHESRFVLL